MDASEFNPAVLPPQVMKDHEERIFSENGSRHFLYPGQIYVSREPVTITTILGSCAAVCLWDMRRKVGGMNHYLLPEGPADSPNRLRYGNIANRTLLQELIALGAEIRDLQAKVFGGSSAFAADPLTALGTRNIEMAEAFLRESGIRIAARDVSGRHGRKLLFHTGDGNSEIKSFESTK